MTTKVSIIILNWNGLEDTIECLESLKKITYPDYEVIVVDNGSTGNDAEVLREKFGGYIHLIQNDKNYGFAEGNNIGMRYALSSGADYILILNNDTVVAPNSLTELVKAMEEDAQAGIAGPTCYYYDKPKTIQFTGIMISWWTGRLRNVGQGRQDTGQYHGAIEVDCVSGCAMLVTKRLLERISLFDPRFPFGNEDYEFCTRARREHFKVIFVRNSKIWHKVSRSRKKLMNNPEEREILLKEIGDLRIREWLWFSRTYSRSRWQRVSQAFFYFVVTLPWLALLSLKRDGFKITLAKTKSALKEIKSVARMHQTTK
jgi:GT2 family glycosyltransferase